MKEYLELTPELLMQQSQEMMTLKTQYETLFDNLLKDLQGMNASWSPNLSNNFSGKISSAQKGFAGVAKMLENGSYAAILAAHDLGGMDTTLGKLIGGSAADISNITSQARTMYNFTFGDKMVGDAIEDAKEWLDKIDKIKANYEGELTSSQEAWLELLQKKARKLTGKGADGLFGKGTNDKIKDFELAYDVTEKLIKGDWEGAMEKLGEEGVDELVEKYCEVMGIDTSDYVTGKKVEWYTKYGLNLFKDGVEGVTEIAYEGPTFENVGKLGWNLTAQPILDTTSDKMFDVIKLIPGTSEYYIDEKGCKDAGDMGNVALGDWYGMISPDPGMKEYASTYYEKAGGIWEGMWQGGEEWMSFVKDSGGWGEAIKNYSKTAWKDTKEAWDYNVENAEILWKEGKEWVENVGDFVEEQGGVYKATGEFIETAAKDAWDGITDTASRVWNSIFSKETVDILKGKK